MWGPFIIKQHDAIQCFLTQTCHLISATGREVFDWILDQGYYSERDTSNVMRQVLEAVAYLHSLKIVHRNLKVGLLLTPSENKEAFHLPADERFSE